VTACKQRELWTELEDSVADLLYVGYGKLEQSDVLVLTLDMTDIESHAAATDIVMKHFGQVDIAFFLLFLLLS